MKQIINELKSQPVIAAVTIIGTALAIFLIMVVVMLQQVRVVPMAPESNRDRIMYVTAMRAWSTDTTNQFSGSWALGTDVVEHVFSNLKIPKEVSVYNRSTDEQIARAPGESPATVDTRHTDDAYFRIYDFDFIAGAPYDSADVASHLRKAVIVESLARNLFHSPEKAVGADIDMDGVPYSVVGVVADVSPVTDKAYAQVWMPLDELVPDEWQLTSGLGPYGVAMLARDGEPLDAITDEVLSRLKIYNAGITSKKIECDFNGGPYTQEAEIEQMGTNNPADLGRARMMRWTLYIILLLVPAINLSSMTRSRLAYRTAEIGVRRAFGATRLSIMLSILSENMIITLIGGIIGLGCSLIFGSLLFDAIFSAGIFETYNTVVTAGAGALLDWSTFAYALLFCFILNIFSSGLPAWRAARMNPVEAITTRTK